VSNENSAKTRRTARRTWAYVKTTYKPAYSITACLISFGFYCVGPNGRAKLLQVRMGARMCQIRGMLPRGRSRTIFLVATHGRVKTNDVSFNGVVRLWTREEVKINNDTA
jgi:hypothetical protein